MISLNFIMYINLGTGYMGQRKVCRKFFLPKYRCVQDFQEFHILERDLQSLLLDVTNLDFSKNSFRIDFMYLENILNFVF